MVQCYFAVQEGPGRAATSQPCPPAERYASPSSSDSSAATRLALQLPSARLALRYCGVTSSSTMTLLASMPSQIVSRASALSIQLDTRLDVLSQRREARNERRKAVTSCCAHECSASPQPRETAATCGLSPSPVQIRKASNPDGTYEGFSQCASFFTLLGVMANDRKKSATRRNLRRRR